MSVFKKFEENFEKWILILSLIAMVIIVFMQVVLRWIGRPTVWAEELSRYIMLYQVWIGVAYAVRENAHIAITAFINKLTGQKRKLMDYVVIVLWMIFSVWLMVQGIELVRKVSVMGQVSSAMQIPMTIPYASVPIGGLLMTIRLLQKLVLLLSDRSSEEREVI